MRVASPLQGEGRVFSGATDSESFRELMHGGSQTRWRFQAAFVKTDNQPTLLAAEEQTASREIKTVLRSFRFELAKSCPLRFQQDIETLVRLPVETADTKKRGDGGDKVKR
jgi:hypothetical protein